LKNKNNQGTQIKKITIKINGILIKIF